MSDTVIQVENLGKKYIIGHQQEERYTALRDVITNKIKSLGTLIQNPKSKIQNSQEEFWALNDVSFEIKQGDRVGIIGRNGAGKSTLLKILSRITEPTKGSIKIKGRVASLLEVGTGFHPELTGRENIYLNGAILGMSKEDIKRKFDEIVAFAEIEKFLDTPVKRYSSGMYVRLAFAVAAHLEPEILIVDEVLAVGDAQFQKKCLGKMEDVGKEGRTVIFVSHNMAAISLLCQKGLFIQKGMLVTNSTISNCIELYTQTQAERSGLLLEHQVIKVSGLKITDIKVNGLDEDKIYIDSTVKPLEVVLVLNVNLPCRIALYGSLKDSQGHSIAIYSPGQVSNEVYGVVPGIYKLYGVINLPRLTKGIYFLELGIAEPGVQFYIYFPFGIELDIAGSPTKSGIVYEQAINDAGYQILDGYSSLEKDLSLKL
ncbi:ABC transporter-like protein [Nostoc carneum NIES-2107]|nr:ABC transporter-like protein [Nostoc carneum NIES-2107]